ncbi:uncharacterized protein zgc:153292 [Lampris incognitus]|uniref:uncharacterized protein zgc:153292 n=1 Tax=Lampris incognitus TaxID=2546036 RepID=UPI0024B55FB8|nr:uncharacterized protein zgc:153292 [Lampris incognitus]
MRKMQNPPGSELQPPNTSQNFPSLDPEFPDLSRVPVCYHDLKEVFSKARAISLPLHQAYDCAIDLLPGTSPPKDISIFSPDEQTHIQCVRRVLQRLLHHQLFVKAEKGEFHVPSVSFLGFIMSEGEVRMDPEKCAYGYQPPLFPALEREASVPSALALVRRCCHTWARARRTLIRNSERCKKAADRRWIPAPTYRSSQRCATGGDVTNQERKHRQPLIQMGRFKCSAFNCENSNLSDVKFFKFPLHNRAKLKKWLIKMKWKDWTPSRFSVLCINHFEEQHIDRTGRFIKLRPDAVPTIFSFPEKGNWKPFTPEASQTKPAHDQSTAKEKPDVHNQQSSQTNEVGTNEPVDGLMKSTRWSILMDESLAKIESFPYFFHGDYCIPQDIQWAADDHLIMECEDPDKIIEVKEPWQWLSLDVRGPLPLTLNGHTFILTVTDYYSKWVEAVPMQSCLSSHITKHIMDIISHFGYPFRILSRLPHDIVGKINTDLREKLKIHMSLVVHHQQTGTADWVTQRSIDRMVNELIEQHSTDWDVFLPARVFNLCFKEHSETKERPFSRLCCKELQPVQTPRGLNLSYSNVRESTFVIR